MSKQLERLDSPVVSPLKLQTDPTLNDFDIQLIIYKNQQLALAYLKKIPNKRTNSENYVIFKVMMQIKFFQDLAQNYGKETVEICCSCLHYKCTQAGQVLFKQGEIGDAFYIIMRGSVGVNINTYSQIEDTSQKKAMNGEQTIDTQKLVISSNLKANVQQNQQQSKNQINLIKATNKAILLNNLSRKSGEFRQSNIFIEGQVDNKEESKKDEAFEEKILLQPILQEVKTLKTGDSFGELALLKGTKGAQRAATIISKELTYYAYLVREDFQNILKDKEQDKLNYKISFLSKCSLFEGLEDNELRSIFLYCQVKVVIKDHIVYKQNDTPDYFYIIKSGDFQVIKTQQIKDKKEVSYYEDVQMPASFRNFHGRASKETGISILSEGQFFGHLEILKKSERKYTVKCISSQGELYSIQANDFVRKIYYHQKEFLKKRLTDDRQQHSNLYDKQEEKLQDINEQNSHLLLQNSYDKQYYDKIMNYTRRNTERLPTVIQNSASTPKNFALSQLISPISLQQIQQQQSSQKLQNLTSVEKITSPKSQQLNSSRSNISFIIDQKRVMDVSQLSIKIFNKNQQDTSLQKINDLFSATPRMKRDLSENFSITEDQYSLLSRKTSIIENHRKRDGLQQQKILHQPSIEKSDQILTFSNKIERSSAESTKKQIANFNRPLSLNLNLKLNSQKETSIKIEGEFKEMSSQQKILHSKLSSDIFTSSSKMDKIKEFHSPQFQKLNLLNLPLLQGSQSSKNRKSIFIKLKYDSGSQREALSQLVPLNVDKGSTNIATSIHLGEQNQTFSLLHNNISTFSVEEKERQEQSPRENLSNRSYKLRNPSAIVDELKFNDFNDSFTKELINKYQANLVKKKQDNFHRRQKTMMEQKHRENHQKMHMEMHNIQEQERIKKQQIQDSAIQVINRMDGYRQLKLKLESIKQAVEARSERGTINKETKKEILNKFFLFMKNQDSIKGQNKKNERFKFTDFRSFEKIIVQKAQTIKAHHQLRKSQIEQQLSKNTLNSS